MCQKMVVMNYTVNEWAEDDLEKMKNIPPLENCIARIPIDCHKQIAIIILLECLLGGGIWLSFGRGKWMREMDFTTFLWIIVIGSLLIGFEELIGRKERGFFAIYPEMLVIYWYDTLKKRVRVWNYFYWQDVVQYSKRENAIWFESVEKYPFCPQFKMKKLRPYLEKYAPHAKVITFDVENHMKKKEKQEWEEYDAEYHRQMKGYKEKEKALVEEARRKAKEQQEKDKR